MVARGDSVANAPTERLEFCLSGAEWMPLQEWIIMLLRRTEGMFQLKMTYFAKVI
jgi:hypothetical protein